MGKSYRRGSDSRYYDDLSVYSKNEKETAARKREKRLSAALRAQDVRNIIDPEDDEEEF